MKELEGFLVIDKAPGMTSHDVVAVVRAVTGVKKVGHTGTLDPFATGVLPLALGGCTRLIRFLDEEEKIYDAHVLLGSATDTGDPTGKVIEEKPVPPLEEGAIREMLNGFVGPRMQTPPRYSAVKVAGRRLYDYARKGETVQAEPRPIRIFEMRLLELDPPRLRVLIRCTRGTYARVLAEDIGEALGTVGHLDELRRLGSGRFDLEGAVSFSRLASIVAGSPDWDRVLRPARGDERVPWKPREEVAEGLSPWVVGARQALSHLPSVQLGALEVRRYQQAGTTPPPPPGCTGPFALLEGDRVLGVAIVGQADKPPGKNRRHGRR